MLVAWAAVPRPRVAAQTKPSSFTGNFSLCTLSRASLRSTKPSVAQDPQPSRPRAPRFAPPPPTARAYIPG